MTATSDETQSDKEPSVLRWDGGSFFAVLPLVSVRDFVSAHLGPFALKDFDQLGVLYFADKCLRRSRPPLIVETNTIVRHRRSSSARGLRRLDVSR